MLNSHLRRAGFICLIASVPIAQADVFGSGENQFTIEFVPISSSTNPESGYGIVTNDYRMGAYEITNDQWAKFKSELGIPVTGNPTGAYNAESIWTAGTVPTNNVSWFEAAQFVNWLNTSKGYQPAYRFTGTQGTPNYSFALWGPDEADNGTNLYRHSDAFYYLPTEDEWVKAGYWNGAELQQYANAHPGDLISGNPDPLKWNHVYSPGSQPWEVGTGAMELNGTFDLMGNLQEWMENPWTAGDYGTASVHGLRGGAYYDGYAYLGSGYRYFYYSPHIESQAWGFRVASEIPEPPIVAASVLGSLILFRRRSDRGGEGGLA